MKPTQAALFDHLASGAALYTYPPEALAKLRALVPSRGRVLDVGCGDGAPGAALDAASTVGFDISHRCAVLAKAKGLRALVADATAPWPFCRESFDAVVCFDVLHHCHGAWERILSEADRVLRSSGALVFVEPDARNPFVRWTQAPRSPIRVAPFDDEPAIEPESLLAPARAMGYDVRCAPIHIEAEQVVRGVFPLWRRVAKAPFVLALSWWCRHRPNKFALVAVKPGRKRDAET